MKLFLPSHMEALHVVLLSGYVIFCVLLNVIAYLISVFYRKKFARSSPTGGFLIAMLAAAAFVITLFMRNNGIHALHMASAGALLISGAATIISITNLYFTMRKVRK